MDNTQSKDSQSFDDAMRKIWGPTWGKFCDINGKDDFQKRTAPDMNKGQASKELQSEIAALKKLLNDIFVSLQSANEKFTKISEAVTSGSSSSVENNRNNNSISKREKKNSNSQTNDKSYFRVFSRDSGDGEKDLKREGVRDGTFPFSPQNNNSISKRENNNSNSQSNNKSYISWGCSGSGDEEKNLKRIGVRDGIFSRLPRNNNSISKREDSKSNGQNSNKSYFRASSSGSGKSSSSSSDESSGDGERDNNDNSDTPMTGRRRRRQSKRMQRSGKNDSNFISSSSSARTNNSSSSNLHTDADLQSLKEKIKDLENKSAVWESQIKSLKGKSQAVDPQSAEPSYELQLQERKKNNLVFFGLQEDEQDDINQLKALLSDLGADVHLDDTKFFRTGRSLEKCRPLILQLESQEEKAKILFNAKKLKNNKTWTGVSITHDLTKQQCQTEKLKEMELKKEAVEKNSRLSQEEKSTRVWKVVGGRGTRCLILRNIEKPQNQG